MMIGLCPKDNWGVDKSTFLRLSFYLLSNLIEKSGIIRPLLKVPPRVNWLFRSFVCLRGARAANLTHRMPLSGRLAQVVVGKPAKLVVSH